MRDDDVDLLRSESEILQSLSHENIVRFKHVGLAYSQTLQIKEVGGKIFLAMELMSLG